MHAGEASLVQGIRRAEREETPPCARTLSMKRRTHLSPNELRLLRDLIALEFIMRPRRPPARKRLERELGVDFAHSLHASLVAQDLKAA